jgi:hypothetical protein
MKAQWDLDAHVREMVDWHFDPDTGSPYWLRRAASLGFDPRREIRTFADLSRFPPVADEWREVAAADLVPQGAPGPFSVWETGGTTGPPRRVVDAHERAAGMARINRLLEAHGFPGPGGGDWLHVGPSGPHLVGTNVGRLARMRGALCHSVDLDPRWVKKLYAAGRGDEAKRYAAHIADQAVPLLRTQPIQILTVTPPLLQALCEHPDALPLLEAKVKGVIWFGTSLSDEALRLLEEEILPDAVFVGWYGNTLAGIACQRPRQPGDPYRAIFTPPEPSAFYRLVDPADPGREVGYGESGQARISVLNREVFLPWHLERDRAVRVEPAEIGGPDCLARVEPLGGGGVRVEGVY